MSYIKEKYKYELSIYHKKKSYDLSIQNKRLCVSRRREFLSRCTTQRGVVGEGEGEEEVTATPIHEYIPTNVSGMEILSYLPGKKLQTLKIVCKDWLQLITSSDFVRLHLSKSIRSRIRVLIKRNGFDTIIEYNTYDKGTVAQIAYPPQFSSQTRIFGSANGLAFLYNNHVIGVFNPSTAESSVVQLCPSPPTHMRILCPCFGDLGGGEYVLVMGMLVLGVGFESWAYKFTRGSVMNRICSNHNSLREFYEILDKKGTFVRGVVYWPVQFRVEGCLCYKILAYHLGENKHMEISPPAQCDFRMGLFVDGCSLLATSINFSVKVTTLWIMKEEDCWTKHAIIRLNINYMRIDPLGFFPNGDLIMDVDKRWLLKYSFNHDEVTLLIDYGGDPMEAVIMCADTLLSPNCIWTTG